MKKIFKRLGFTLAEILIVIGIIGGVAIMVLPTLKDNYEEHVFEARAKATYNILQQAVALSKYSGDRYYGADPEVFFNKYIKESIKLARNDGDTENCYDRIYTGENIPSPMALDGTTIKKVGGILSAFNKPYNFSLNNGAEVYIGTAAKTVFNLHMVDNYPSDSALIIIFDTNGGSEPNIYGLDIFFTYWNGRELVPLGDKVSLQNVNKNCSTSGGDIDLGMWNGTYCLQYMIDNGWKLKKEIKDKFL